MIKLKHAYISKKEGLIKKLDTHQEKMENIFKVYYDKIDEMRFKVLEQEYKLRDNMDYFEHNIQNILRDIKKYNYIEFYHE